MASAIGIQQLTRTQGIEWGDSANGDTHLWIADHVINTDAALNLAALSFGSLVLTDTSSKITPGGTALLFRNHADTVTNMSLTDIGALTVTGQAGASSGVAGTGHTFNTGAANAAGNGAGGNFAINLGDGNGTGAIGQFVITSTPTGTPTGTPGLATALALNQTALASGATSVAYMSQWNHLWVTGAGANYTSTFHAAGEFYGINQTTGNLNAVMYGAEGSSVQDSNGTLLKMVGLQGNLITGTSVVGTPGLVTSASAVVADIQLTKGTVTNLSAFSVAQAAQGTSIATQIIGYDSLPLVNDSAVSAGNSTVGSYNAYCARFYMPTQTGNTSGTNTLAGLLITGSGGVPGAGGVINNYGIQVAANAAAATLDVGIFVGALGSNAASLTGQGNRAGMFTVPNGGGNAAGTVTNYGVYITTNSGGTGTSTTGGSVTNASLLVEVSAAVAASGGGTTNNYGLQITGNGNGGSTGQNQAIRCTSTAGGVLNGPWTLGGTTSPTASCIGIADAFNLLLGTTTGTKIGTATTQKLAFFNSTPVVQPAASADVTGFAAGSGTASKSDSVWAGASGASAYTVGGIVTALKALGLLAS